MSKPTLNLNDNHRNTLLAGFRYIDRLLAEAVAGLTPAEDGAIFTLLIPDATPVQRKIISDQVARVRRAIRAALEACSVSIRPPPIGALWSLQSSLISIDIALEELGPAHLRGYGSIDDATAEGIRTLQAQIRTVLADLQNYVASGSGANLAARLERLDQTRDEVRLLSELERVIRSHGLVELRHALSLLLDRLEKNRWTVAFVGRVSCGKSSLLNYLLVTDILPSGVTPVTAVPIRIVPGPELVATVSFASSKPVRIPGAQIGEFASEERNPGNRRQVTDIVLEMPATRLAGDVCFVDTPGLGSLATAGGAQTLGFLPRCDLGVFLLDCSSTLTEEDLAVIRTLFECGADVLVVLSKADLLGPADRDSMLAYVGRQLAASLSREVPISLVSVADGHATLTEAWFAHALAPRQAMHLQLAAQALRRKAGGLKEAVIAALNRYCDRFIHASISLGSGANLGAAQAALEGNRRRLFDLVFRATPSVDAVVDEAADILVRETVKSPEDRPKALAEILARIASRVGDACEKILQETRLVIARSLEQAGRSAAVPELPIPASRPLFDPAATAAAVGVDPNLRRWPTGVIRRALLRRSLRIRGRVALDESLRAYGSSLIAWGQQYLDDLGRQFNAEVGIAESGLAAVDPAAPSPGLIQDLELLRNWNSLARDPS